MPVAFLNFFSRGGAAAALSALLFSLQLCVLVLALLTTSSHARPVTALLPLAPRLTVQDWSNAGFSAVLNAGKDAVGESALSETWSDCGNPDDILHIKRLELTPDPPKRGDDLRLNAEVVLDEDVVPGAKAHVRVRLGVIKLLDKDFDLCDELKKQDNPEYQCPIKAGPLTISETIHIPREIPSGRYMVNVRVHNADEKPVACVNVKVVF